MNIFLWIILFLSSIYSQAINPVFVFSHAGVDQWSEGSTTSPVYYGKNGRSMIVSAAYWVVYAVDAETGNVNTYTGVPPTSLNEQGRFETGIVMIEDLYTPGDVAFIIGGENTEVSIWDPDGNILHNRHVDLATGRGVRTVSAAKFSPSDPWSIIVGLPSTNMGRYPNTWILDPFLTEVWKRPIQGSPEGSYSLGVFGKNHGVYDLNGNGNLEIIIPSDDYSVCVWDKDGVQYGASDVFYNADNWWSWVIFSRDYQHEFRGWAGDESHADHKPFFAHGITTVIPIDNQPVIAISGLYNWGFHLEPPNPTYQYHTVFLLKENRERYTNSEYGWDWTLSYEGCTGYQHADDLNFRNGVPIAYADLNGNGFPELIFPCTDGRLHAIGIDKLPPYMGWPYDLGSVSGHLRKASEPAIFQRENECPTIVFTTYGQREETPRYYGKLIFLDCQGQELNVLDLPTPIGDHNSGSISGPTLFRKESGNDNLFVAINTIFAGVTLYEIENTENAVILWETERGSVLRNGNPPNSDSYPFVAPIDMVFVRTMISIGVGCLIAVIAMVCLFIIIIGMILCVFIIPKRKIEK